MDTIKKDLWSTSFWLLFAIYISIESYHLGLGSWNMPGPGYFPFGAGVLLGTISLSLLVKIFLREPFIKIPGGLSVSAEEPNWRNVILTPAAMLVFVAIFNWLGFLSSTFLLMIFFLRVIGKRTWLFSLIAGASITLSSYLLFELTLDAELPKGIMEGLFRIY